MYSSSEDESNNSGSSDPGVTSVVIVAGVLGAIILSIVAIMIVKKYRNQKKCGRELQPLVAPNLIWKDDLKGSSDA